MTIRDILSIQTPGRGTIDVSNQINESMQAIDFKEGLCHLFLQHTSASLILCENYDPDVKVDLENFLSRLAPDGDPLFTHTMEGDDDMPAHIRSIITHNDLTIPVEDGKLMLGTWQGIYLYEHRANPHQRKIIMTLKD